jgi:ureidoacrylate peracid hydrolase
VTNRKLIQRKPKTADRPALLVIDMQNDFLEDDGYFVKARGRPYTAEQKRKLYGECRSLIDEARQAGVPVIYVRTALRADGLDSALSHKSAARPVADTWGARIVDVLQPAKTDVVVDKTGLSGFRFTPLQRILRNLEADSIILVGGPLYEGLNATGRDASAHGYSAFAVLDAMYPPDFPNPEFLRMRMRTIASEEARDRIRTARVAFHGAHRAALGKDWRTLLADSCLLLIDLQNGFVRRDGFMSGPHALWPEYRYREDEYQALLENNARLIEWARQRGMPVINTRAVVRPDTINSALFAETQRRSDAEVPRGGCFEGDWNAEFAEEIAPHGEDIELKKPGHSAFVHTVLDRMLVNLGVRQCIVSGGNIGGCVEETLRDGCALGYSMLVVRDATYRPGDPRIDLVRDEVDIVTTEELLRCAAPVKQGSGRAA